MTHKDYRYFKQQLKHGHRITLRYNEHASTGEIASTHSNYKVFKQTVKQLQKENIKFNIHLERNKYHILQDIREILNKIQESADLISPDKDTIWHDYVDQLNDKLFDLTFYI